MQQTEKYQLNLIETSDPFSPEALNENTQKVENALIAHEEAVEEVTDALLGQSADLDSRVAALEVHKIAVGTYKTSNAKITVNVGFTPLAVFAQGTASGMVFALEKDSPLGTIVPNGFSIETDTRLNPGGGYVFAYLALA